MDVMSNRNGGANGCVLIKSACRITTEFKMRRERSVFGFLEFLLFFPLFAKD